VLHLTLPKAEQARTKQIPIRSAQPQLSSGKASATNGQQAQPTSTGRR
jgi:hypothetical protein